MNAPSLYVIFITSNQGNKVMKKTWITFNLLVLIFTFSCEDEYKPSCPPPSGKMIALVNDTTEWDFKHVYFRRWSETDFASQWADSSIGIFADFINAGCEMELTLNLLNIAQTLNRQSLVKVIREDGHPSRLQPNSTFYTWDVDALTERFELFESEPAWIELSQITDEQIKGIFQGTYVYRQSTFRFWDLPDTLRFNKVPFEAILLVPPVE